MKLVDKIIRIRTIVYDRDASQTYVFCDFDKALAAVEGSIRSYVGEDDGVLEEIYEVVLDKVHQLRNEPCIPIAVNKLLIIMYQWDIDHMHPIHQVLRDCYEQVDDDLKSRISSLFEDVSI